MDFKEKAKQKYAAYTSSGFICSDINDEDEQSSFVSEKDGVKRLHIFKASTMTVDFITDVVEEEKPTTKKPRKKKGE